MAKPTALFNDPVFNKTKYSKGLSLVFVETTCLHNDKELCYVKLMI